MKRIGFLINPIAGLGGKVGLKGTDGVVEEALEKGAVAVAQERAEMFLRALDTPEHFDFYTCSDSMGGRACKNAGITAEIIYDVTEPTSADDTKKACSLFVERADMIVFVGGDGTACDVYDAVGCTIPVVGVPSGVKMYSAVFSYTPADAAEILNNIDELSFTEHEVMDIDEDAFREGLFKTAIKGYLKSPVHKKIQLGKNVDEGCGKPELVAWVLDSIDNDNTYIIGGGSTTWALKQALEVEGSFLGIDIVKHNILICKDAGEHEIVSHMDDKTHIIISPLGKQGFIFGRGNQPITAEVIRKVGKDNIHVIATREKVNALESLKVDTGNTSTDEYLRGYLKVIIGYNESRVMKVE